MLTLYLIFSAVVILCLIIQYPIFSYLSLFLLSLLVTGWVFFPVYHSVNIGLLAFFLLLPLCRLIYLVFLEIHNVVNRMSRRRSISAISKTCLLWLPFPLFAVMDYYMLEIRNQHVYGQFEHIVYEQMSSPTGYACHNGKLICKCEASLKNTHLCPVVDTHSYRIKGHASPMERDIHIAVQRLKNRFRQNMLSQIQSNRNNITQAIRENGGDIEKVLFDGELTRQKLLAEMRKMATMPSVQLAQQQSNKWPVFKYFLAQYHPDFLPPSCSGLIDQLFKLQNCIEHMVLEPLSEVYIDIRRRLYLHTVQIIAKGEGSVEEKLAAVEKMVEEVLDHYLYDYSRQAHQGVENKFSLLNTTDRIFFLVWVATVIYALLVGFLYLFIRYVYNHKHGRVLFSANPSMNCELNDVDSCHLKRTVVIEDITVDDTMNHFSQAIGDETWYASIDSALRYEVDGIICLPRPLTLLLKRLPGRYLLFRYRRQEGKKMISAHADGLTRFIKITLTEDQSVCFNFSNLVAFSNSLQMKTTLNISLAAFFQTQLFFSTAVGPGELIIKTKNGRPEIMPNSTVKPSDPRDVVVFDMQGQYSLLADMNPLSAYFLGHRIIPNENTALIRQSPNAKSSFSSQASAIRRALYLLLPLTFFTIILPWLLP